MIAGARAGRRALTARWRRGRRPLVLGHRGGRARHTENSLAGFAAARDAGLDGVELDVRLSRDGGLWVFHDDDLHRLAGRGGSIEGLAASELRAVRLVGGHPIPTLDQVLEELGDRPLVDVELKATRATRAGLVARAAAAIRRHRAADRVLVSSFDPLAVARFRLAAREVAVGWLFHRRQPAPLSRGWLAPLLRPHAVHPEHTLVSWAAVDRWHRAGLLVATWTVDAPAELRRVDAAGVDVVIADDPEHARDLLGG